MKDAKFWPGELGFFCTHALFQARLIIDGKNHGVQSFVCQIRDLDDHKPLKGLEVGDIGPKYGFAAKDNGYLIFNNFKIPRTALLSRFVQCTRDGKFVQKGDPRVGYSTMMLMRIQMIEGSAPYVLKPLMIAARYTEQRRQFKTIPNSLEERRIIDYQATQTKLVSAMAFAWVSKFMSYKCTIMYKAMIEEIHKKNKFKTMKDLHSLASAIKAYYMEECLSHAKIIRECLGAHAYLSVSEIPEIIEMVAPNVTLEGDGCVMYQQTAKDIFKSVGRLTKGKEIKGTYSYLQELPNYIDSKLENKSFDDVTVLIDILKAATIYQIIEVGNNLRKQDELSFDVKWNKVYLKDIINTAKLHSIYISAQT